MMMKFDLNNGRPIPVGLASALAAAGFLFAPLALAQTQLPPPAAYTQADRQQDRIEELERQLREATAENEAVQRQLFEANREITRLRAMVGELASVNQSATQNPEATTTPMGGATNPTPPADAIKPEDDARARATGSLGTLSATQLPPPAARDPAAEYAAARRLLNNGNYAEAEVAFANFMEDFEDSENAADARYWYAFTLLARNNHANAARNFVTYLTETPRGQYGPDAQVRLGMALAGMARDGQNPTENMRQACGAFASLTRRYPNASANVRALAQREARAAQCPA